MKGATLLSGAPSSIPAAYWSAERQALRDATREFAMKEVLPLANRLDPVQGEIPMSLRDQLAKMGYFGILIPEQYGGLGLGIVEYVLITEELARAWMSVASIIARGNGLGAGFTSEMRERLLPRMARGECLGAFALSEPDAGSDVASIRCRAERDGDHWVINGQKMWCTFADGADFLLLVARATPYDPANRHAGIAQFFVEKPRGSFPEGISGTPMRKVGYHGWKTWELSFDNFRIPLGNILLPRRDDEDAAEAADKGGFKRAMKALSSARVHTAARSIGLARGALEDSIAYMQQRIQFGRPIGDFQYLRFKVADMATQIEAARRLMYSVADDLDHDRSCDVEASMVKLFASEMSERVTSDGIQIHGGAGYTSDYPVERYWRDARLTKIFEGTSEIQMRIISDAHLPRPKS
ncbi:MAG: acyl-CoA dehydrogenase family protein [Deltaproteobacteria bacterium]|nr:acyl-CoA dehydrogenase family protein [Deltaproteobacteria bacterium]